MISVHTSRGIQDCLKALIPLEVARRRGYVMVIGCFDFSPCPSILTSDIWLLGEAKSHAQTQGIRDLLFGQVLSQKTWQDHDEVDGRQPWSQQATSECDSPCVDRITPPKDLVSTHYPTTLSFMVYNL